MSWQIEIKIGKDRLSYAQIRQKEAVTAAGGVYIVARTFAGFIDSYCSLTGISHYEAFTLPNKTIR
jgi:hypothetical protein